MKDSKLMKERVRRVDVLLRELGCEMLEGECGFLRLALEPMRYMQSAGAASLGRRDPFKVTEIAPSGLSSDVAPG